MPDLRTQIETLSRQQGEPQWFLDRRLDAYKQMESLPMPKVERAGKLNRFPLDVVPVPDALQDAPSQHASVDPAGEIHVTLYHNEIIQHQLPESLTAQGVIVDSLHAVLANQPEIIETYYMQRAMSIEQDQVAAHHAAWMNAGLVVYVPRGVEVTTPLQVKLMQNGKQPLPYHLHVLVVLEAGASLTYIEQLTTDGNAASSANIAIEVVAMEQAQLKYVAIDDLSEATTTYLRRYGYVGRDANVDWVIGAMNNGDTLSDYYTHLAEPGAQTDLKVVSLTHGHQAHVINSKIINAQPHTSANILQHGVILGESTLTMNGIGHILKGSKQAFAEQESRVLMLSDGARGDANPILLIDEFEVVAGHAASVGQVDAEQLYYLMSRGIAKEEAERLVIRGFLGPVIQAIPLASERDRLVQSIEGKLRQL